MLSMLSKDDEHGKYYTAKRQPISMLILTIGSKDCCAKVQPYRCAKMTIESCFYDAFLVWMVKRWCYKQLLYSSHSNQIAQWKKMLGDYIDCIVTAILSIKEMSQRGNFKMSESPLTSSPCCLKDHYIIKLGANRLPPIINGSFSPY